MKQLPFKFEINDFELEKDFEFHHNFFQKDDFAHRLKFHSLTLVRRTKKEEDGVGIMHQLTLPGSIEHQY